MNGSQNTTSCCVARSHAFQQFKEFCECLKREAYYASLALKAGQSLAFYLKIAPETISEGFRALYNCNTHAFFGQPPPPFHNPGSAPESMDVMDTLYSCVTLMVGLAAVVILG